MASSGIANVLEVGKLAWPDMLYYQSIVQPQNSKQAQSQAEIEQMMEIFKNAQ